MKKTFIILLSVLFLVSCNSTSTSNSNLSSVSLNSSNNSSNEYDYNPNNFVLDDSLSKEKLVKELKDHVKEHNYTLTSFYGGVEYTDVFNQEYYFNDLGKKGYLLLESPYEKKIFYTVNLSNYEVGNPLVSYDKNDKKQPVTSIEQIDFLSLINDDEYQITSASFTSGSKKGCFKTYDKNLIKAFSKLIGLSSYYQEGAFYGVEFSRSTNGDYAFEMLESSLASNKIIKEERTGYLHDFGLSYKSEIQNFIDNYKLSSNIPTSALISPYLNKNGKFSNTIYRVVNDDKASIGTEEFKYTNSRYSSSLQSKSSNSIQIFKEGKNDDLVQVALNGENKVEEIKASSYKWSTMPFMYKYIDKNLLRETNSGTYHYYGIDVEEVSLSISKVSLPSGFYVNSIDFKIEDNKLSKVILITNKLFENDKEVFYQIEANFDSSSTEVNLPTPLKENENTSKISNLLNEFKTSNFEIISNTSYNSAKIKYTSASNIFLKESYDHQNKKTINGTYLTSENKLQDFAGTDSLQIQGRPYEGKITDSYKMDVSPNIFDFDQDGNIVLRDNIVNLDEVMLLGYYSQMLISNTFKIKVEDNHITKIVYDYDLLGGYQGEEELSINFSNSITIPSDLQKEINELPLWEKPTTWKEENDDIYQALLKFYDNNIEVINSIPYFYSENTTGKWGKFEGSTKEFNIFNFFATLDDYDSFLNLFKQNGFTEYTPIEVEPGQNDPNYRRVYLKKDKVSLKLEFSLDNEYGDDPEYELDMYFYK